MGALCRLVLCDSGYSRDRFEKQLNMHAHPRVRCPVPCVVVVSQYLPNIRDAAHSSYIGSIQVVSRVKLASRDLTSDFRSGWGRDLPRVKPRTAALARMHFRYLLSYNSTVKLERWNPSP